MKNSALPWHNNVKMGIFRTKFFPQARGKCIYETVDTEVVSW